MQSEEDWKSWFCNYTDFLMHYANLAETCNIEIFCIGTELLIPATQYPEHWRNMIAQVRSVYSGKLTYAANFYREFEEISWWDDLDYIGIQGYFPLCEKETPTKEEMRKGWQPHLQKMKAISKKFDLPVIFTEIGYRNDPKAASEPWLWPSQIDRHATQVDNEFQARCYEAFFENCWEQDWFVGVFFWKWFHGTWRYPTHAEYFKERFRVQDSLVQIGEYPANYRQNVIGFTPQGRKAQEVMREYYGN